MLPTSREPEVTTSEQSLVGRLRAALPRGNSLPDADWKRRHRFLLALLWLHVAGLPLFGLLVGVPAWRCALWGAVLGAMAVVCTLGRDRRAWWVSATMSVALLTASAVLISFWDGRIEAHFHFFVMIVLLTLYEEWLPFIIAALYVALHHGVVGVLDPGAVYDHEAAQRDPWGWAAIHAGFIVAAGAAALAAWRLNEDVREERQQALDRAVAAERELERSNRDLEQFAAVASHDLSEPLRTVAGFVELIERRYGERLDERGRTYVGHALDGTDRMQRLIDGLLEYSRAGRGAPTLAPVPLDAVVGAACDALHARAVAVGATIAVDDGLPAVLADADELARALQNVLANALKFTPPGEAPQVRISCDPDRDGWCVRVADRGIGVPPEARERVFDMFDRVHGADRYDGAGIGLAVVARIVARHGGRIWLEDTPGGGATVALTLRATTPSDDAPARPVRPPAADLARAGD